MLSLVAAGCLSLVAGNWVNATFSIWNHSVPIDLRPAQLERPGVYAQQLLVSVDSGRIFPSRIRLTDRAQDKFVYTPNVASLYKLGHGLFTIQKKNHLLVTMPSSQTVLAPGWEAVLTFPLLAPSWVINVALILFLACCLTFSCCVPFPTRRWKELAARSVDLGKWVLEKVGTHPLIWLILPSAYVLTVYPPLWKDVDALVQLVQAGYEGNIYHFPALFCFGARGVVWLGDHLSVSRPFDLLAPQSPTLQGIYILIVVQHIGLVLALGLLCKTLTDRTLLRGMFVLLFCLVSSLFANAMLCGSEAWSLCTTIALFAFGLRLYSAKGNATINWIGYGLSLLLAIGSRHINLLVGLWLVGLCLMASVVGLRLGSQKGLPSHPLFKALLALVIFGAAVFSNKLFQFYLAKQAGVEPRATVGQTLSDRIDSFLAQLKPGERLKLSEKLCLMTSDQNVRFAIQDQATIGSFYKGTDQALEKQLSDTGWSGERLQAEKDRVTLESSLIYLRTLHPVLVQSIWKDFLKGFTAVSNASLATDPFEENAYVGTYRQQSPEQWIPLNGLASTFLPESVAWLDRSATDAYLRGFGHVNLASILLLTILLLGLSLWKRRGIYSHTLPAITILLVGVGIFGASMVCANFLRRYVLSMFISVCIALCLSIAGLLEEKKATVASDSA